MAAAISVSPTNPKLNQTATLSISGASAATGYVLRIVHPNGGTETHNIITDGSGNYSQTYVPQENGTVTYNLDPVATTTGTTCSATAKHGH